MEKGINRTTKPASLKINDISVLEELTDEATVMLRGGVITVGNNPCPQGYRMGPLIEMVNGNEVHECIPVKRPKGLFLYTASR